MRNIIVILTVKTRPDIARVGRMLVKGLGIRRVCQAVTKVAYGYYIIRMKEYCWSQYLQDDWLDVSDDVLPIKQNKKKDKTR